MSIIFLPEKVGEAWDKAGEEAHERTLKMQNESCHTCSKCGCDIINSDLWYCREKYYCSTHKPKSARQEGVGAVFTLSDVLKHLDRTD